MIYQYKLLKVRHGFNTYFLCTETFLFFWKKTYLRLIMQPWIDVGTGKEVPPGVSFRLNDHVIRNLSSDIQTVHFPE